MKMFLLRIVIGGYLNFSTAAEIMEFLRVKAKEFFHSNSEAGTFSVAIFDFDTREHSIIEIEIETKFDFAEY